MQFQSAVVGLGSGEKFESGAHGLRDAFAAGALGLLQEGWGNFDGDLARDGHETSLPYRLPYGGLVLSMVFFLKIGE